MWYFSTKIKMNLKSVLILPYGWVTIKTVLPSSYLTTFSPSIMLNSPVSLPWELSQVHKLLYKRKAMFQTRFQIHFVFIFLLWHNNCRVTGTLQEFDYLFRLDSLQEWTFFESKLWTRCHLPLALFRFSRETNQQEIHTYLERKKGSSLGARGGA